MLSILAILIFIVGYAAISLEHKIHINKSATALIIGAFLWLLVAFSGNQHLGEELTHAGSEIFGIVVFLLAAMSLVEILVHYRFFDVVRGKIFSLGLKEKDQFLVLVVLTFFLSAVVDNLTCTIVMVQIAKRFFKSEHLLKVVAAIVIAANAGGAFSPLGDVTTIMLWLAGKFTAVEIITKGFIPSFAALLVLIAWFYPQLKNVDNDIKKEIIKKLSRSETFIITTVFASFLLPVVMNQFSLPPYLGLLLGLGSVWILIDLLKIFRPRETHLTASIDEFIKKTDIPSLKFFIGILLAVSALHSLHILDSISTVLYGEEFSVGKAIIGNTGLGLLSAILDNVPLTAIAIDIMHTSDPRMWVLLALTVGTGGSLLIIGSAAGVIAMGMVKELNFGNYLKLATIPAAVSYSAAIFVWAIQYFVFGF